MGCSLIGQSRDKTGKEFRLSNEIRRFREEFWSFYQERYPFDLDLRVGYKDSNAYLKVDSVNVVIGLWTAVSDQSIGIYLRGPHGDMAARDVQPRLRPYEERFMAVLGIRLIPSPQTTWFAIQKLQPPRSHEQ